MGLSYQITHNRIVMNQERTLTFGKYKGTHRSNITGGFSAGDFGGLIYSIENFNESEYASDVYKRQVVVRDMPAIAIGIIKESNLSIDDCKAAQKRSGSFHNQMMKFIETELA